jgi:hypothetical protein
MSISPHQYEYDADGRLTPDTINAIAKDALAWAQGSWGQSRHDKPRFDHDTMEAIYLRLAQRCQALAELHSLQTR